MGIVGGLGKSRRAIEVLRKPGPVGAVSQPHRTQHAIEVLRKPLKWDAHGHGKNGAGTFVPQLMSVHTTAILNSPNTMPKKKGRRRWYCRMPL